MALGGCRSGTEFSSVSRSCATSGRAFSGWVYGPFGSAPRSTTDAARGDLQPHPLPVFLLMEAAQLGEPGQRAHPAGVRWPLGGESTLHKGEIGRAHV